MKKQSILITCFTLAQFYTHTANAQNNEPLKLVYCDEQAIHHVSIVMPDSVKIKLQGDLNQMIAELKNGMTMTAKPLPPGAGWTDARKREALEYAINWINGKKDEIVMKLDTAVPIAMTTLDAILAVTTPTMQFTGQYSYEKGKRDIKGVWTGVIGKSVGKTEIKTAVSLDVTTTAGVSALVTVTEEVGVKGELRGSLKMNDANTTGVQQSLPTDKPKLGVKIPIFVDISAGMSGVALVGVNLGLSQDVTYTWPAGFVEGELQAGVGILLFPIPKTENYPPVCK